MIPFCRARSEGNSDLAELSQSKSEAALNPGQGCISSMTTAQFLELKNRVDGLVRLSF